MDEQIEENKSVIVEKNPEESKTEDSIKQILLSDSIKQDSRLNLFNYIKIYRNALDEKTCKDLIDLFESCPEKHEKFKKDGSFNFTQLNFTKHFSDTEIHQKVINLGLYYKQKYIADCEINVFPPGEVWEELLITKYNNDEKDFEYFTEHIDNANIENTKRFLSIQWFLNDVKKGGETIFGEPIFLFVECVEGNLLMFPSNWMYPNLSTSPKSNPKYIIESYLHHV